MRNTHIFTAIGVALILAFVSTGTAQILLQDNMGSGAAWTVLGTSDVRATFGYNYALDGVPEAPNSVGGAARTGLKMEANLTAGAAHEVVAIPNGFNLSGQYRIQVDIWMNYAILSGSATEFGGAYIGHDGTTVGRNGSGFIFSGDGDSSRDYRLYKDTTELNLADGYYSPPLGDLPNETVPTASNNNEHPIMMTAYPAFDIGLALEPDDAQGVDQVGLSREGSGGFQWMTLEIIADSAGLPGGGVGLGTAEARLSSGTSGNTLWMGTVDSNRGTVASTVGAPALAYADIFSSLADFPQYQFGIFDNFIIEQLGGTMVDGDFNDDGFWNCGDIDDLSAAVAAMTNDPSFDLNGDMVVNTADIAAWLVEGGAMNPAQTGGNPFLPGDATLDGVVDGQDFIAWNGNKFTNNTAWCGGNFNGDLVIDGQDFITWNQNKFMSSDSISAVPEPTSVVWIAAWVSLLSIRSRNRS